MYCSCLPNIPISGSFQAKVENMVSVVSQGLQVAGKRRGQLRIDNEAHA